MKQGHVTPDDAKCLLCSENGARIGENPDFPQHNIFYCESCEFGWTHPTPSPEELANLYIKTYRDLRREGLTDEYLNNMHTRAKHQRQFIEKSMSAKTLTSVLDIGCGPGLLLRELSSINSAKTSLHGFEPDETMAKFAVERLGPEAHIWNELFAPLTMEANSVQLCTASHLIEHVTDPRRFLDEVMQVLEPRGRLFIECPNESLASVRDLINSRQTGVMHTLFFSESSLCTLLEEQGLQILSKTTYGPKRSEWDRTAAFRQTLTFRLVTFPSRVVKKVLRLSKVNSDWIPPKRIGHRFNWDLESDSGRVGLRLMIEKPG